MVQFSHHLAFLLQNMCTVLACYHSITCRCARNVVSWASRNKELFKKTSYN